MNKQFYYRRAIFCSLFAILYFVYAAHTNSIFALCYGTFLQAVSTTLFIVGIHKKK